MENILIFLPIGIASIILTLFLWLTGKKTEEKKDTDIDLRNIVIFKVCISVFFIAYLVRFTIMFLTGLASNLVLPTVIGCLFALIPLSTLILIRNGEKSKV